ncbi:UPF0161 protein [Canna indica]|uniref:UPF0161 protein n=1 Tax=Canna indica TaxID=4628 RepID=A0AAQ3KIH1_9LILI|nr:UPF0161 protein [Canna indica]
MAASPYPFSHPRLRAPPSPRFSPNTPRRLPSPSHPLVLRQPVSSIPSLHASYGPSFHSPSNQLYSKSTLRRSRTCMRSSTTDKEPEEDANGKALRAPDEEVNNLGVRAALSMLKFYKREISPLMLPSCRYVPTCSEYSMQAYKKYGVVKGTVLTAWRLCRCNPLGGSGFDPPRWFGEEEPHEQP